MLVLLSAMLATAAPVQATDAPAPPADGPILPVGEGAPARPLTSADLAPLVPPPPVAFAPADPSPVPLSPEDPQLVLPPLVPPDAPPAEPVPANDIVVTGRREGAGDPLRAVNAESFAVTQSVDNAVIGPVARTYKRTVPGPIRRGIHNFLYNLREPIVFLNFLLQLKPGKAAETVGRFAINTTVGAAGVLDIAKRKPFRLPRRSNGFANTLGYYGVGNGPFLFLPIVGPTTVRDLLGGAIDRLVLPVAVGRPFNSLSYTIPAGLLGALDHRSEFDQILKDLHDNSPDPYAATRAFYLNRRQAEIDLLHGRVTGDPAGMTGPPPSVRPFVPAHLEPPVTSSDDAPPVVAPPAITPQAVIPPAAPAPAAPADAPPRAAGG